MEEPPLILQLFIYYTEMRAVLFKICMWNGDWQIKFFMSEKFHVTNFTSYASMHRPIKQWNNKEINMLKI
jgi:hypothetical protein